jgi:hypothetical protein
MAERRTGYRQRVLKTGKIIFNGSASVIDCAVRNVSESGACLMVVNAVVVPAEFTLQWDGGSSRNHAPRVSFLHAGAGARTPSIRPSGSV